MKKILESKIILVAISVLLSTTINVVANNVLTSNSVSYTNSKTNETTVEGSLDELFDSADINEKIGSTNITNISEDGTITGTIAALNNNKVITGRISDYSDKSIEEAVWHIHKYMLSNNQSMLTNVDSGGNGNSRIVVGKRITSNRGQYLIMSRTGDELYSLRITDTGYVLAVFKGTVIETEYSG